MIMLFKHFSLNYNGKPKTTELDFNKCKNIDNNKLNLFERLKIYIFRKTT